MLWGSLSTWYRAKACAAQFKIPEWLRLAVLWIKTANRCNYILRHRTHSEVWMGEIWAATMHTIWHQNVFQKPTAIYLLELAPVSGFPAMTFPCLELEREKESQSQHPVLGDSTASDRDCFGGFTNLTSGHLGNWWITLCGWGKVMPLQSSRFLPMLHVQNNFVTFQKKQRDRWITRRSNQVAHFDEDKPANKWSREHSSCCLSDWLDENTVDIHPFLVLLNEEKPWASIFVPVFDMCLRDLQKYGS